MLQTRRSILMNFLSSAALPVVGNGPAGAQGIAQHLGLTPRCGDDDELTLAQDEGPFFKPNAPLRHDLATDVRDGNRITIAGFVIDKQCQPIPGSLLEIWHADNVGRYDNAGFRLRGHQQVDDQGRWWFNTIIPAAYPGRTRHYHFKVQRPGGQLLTTQLYFPGEPLNQRDRLFDKRLLLHVTAASDSSVGRYDFVV
jgi:protocatechuate 3,4-dioxygenase beta subunit